MPKLPAVAEVVLILTDNKMNLSPIIILPGSVVTIPTNAIATTNVDDSAQIKFSIMLRRPQSITDYADGVMAGLYPALSYEEFTDKFSSSNDDLNLIDDFANSAGFTIIKSHGPSATVKLTGTAAQVNMVFGITLIIVTLPDRSYMSYTGSLSIPLSLDGVIEYVLGLDNFSMMKSLTTPVNPANAIAAAATALTPPQVAAAYQFPVATGSGVCIGIIEYGGGYTTQNLTSTFGQIGLSNPTTVDVLVDGGTNNPGDSNGAAEVILDMYVAGGIAPNAKLAMYFGYGGGTSNPTAGPDWYDPINTALNDTTNKPQVLSISWGAGEVTYWTSSTINATNAILAQAPTLGIPVFVSSGDYGSTWSSSSPEVLFPASSPYVVACGGTTLQISGTTITSEVAWTNSGGGISIYNSIPSFQTGKGLTYKTYSAGVVSSLAARGVPDVSGNSDPNSGYQFFWGSANNFGQYGGTSACAPLWAGLIARCIQVHGGSIKLKSTINSLFYNNPSAFLDITSGENASNISVGYSCTSGWDAVTGLGSPIGTAINALFNAISIGGGWRISGSWSVINS